MSSTVKKALPKKNVSKRIAEFKKQAWLQAMVIPGIIFILVFCYIPMYGVVIAFKDFNFVEGIMGSPWVGLKHFKEFFITPNLGNIFFNTLGISISKIIFGFPAPIIFALLINELGNKKLKKTVQSISYLPHFISFVVIAGMMSKLLSPDGAVNNLLLKLGVINESVLFMGEPNYFWAIVVISGIWQGVGYSSILYLAAITGVDPSLYEAAVLDGAGRLRQVWHITIPTILPIIVIQLVMQMNQILNAGFDNILLLQNSMVMERAEVLDTYIYRVGMQDGRYSFSTAVGLLTSIIRITLVLLTNWVSTKITDYGLF